MNIESVPSEAGPDLDGIEEGISNYEVEIAAHRFAMLAMTIFLPRTYVWGSVTRAIKLRAALAMTPQRHPRPEDGAKYDHWRGQW